MHRDVLPGRSYCYMRVRLRRPKDPEITLMRFTVYGRRWDSYPDDTLLDTRLPTGSMHLPRRLHRFNEDKGLKTAILSRSRVSPRDQFRL